MRDDTFEKWVKELQKKIEYDEEQTYSKTVIREYRNPSNFGVIEKPDASGEIKGSCGDTMKITLRVENERITDARFWTDGCGATVACGSMLTRLIKGKTVNIAAEITSEKLIAALDGLPDESLHCSKLTVDTLQKAIKQYRERKKVLPEG